MSQCCYINDKLNVACADKADFQIFDQDSPSEAPIDACEKHVGALLGGPVDGPMPEKWYIYPILKV